MKKILKSLVALGERQFIGAISAGGFIESALKNNSIAVQKMKYKTFLPRYSNFFLRADGLLLPAYPTALVSGQVKSASNLISSQISSQSFIDQSNINFNPNCRSISRGNHYFAPSFAVAPSSLSCLCRAKKVFGSVKVERVQQAVEDLLVGNIKNPKTIIFCHYDSLGPGALDNASGVSVCLSTILSNPAVLKDCLIVFDGNEELSFDYPIYWGHGYRVFERRHSRLFGQAKKILVVDSVGSTKPCLYRDPSTIRLGFPIHSLKTFGKKIVMISGNYRALMSVYHSNLDTMAAIQTGPLEEAARLLRRLI